MRQASRTQEEPVECDIPWPFFVRRVAARSSFAMHPGRLEPTYAVHFRVRLILPRRWHAINTLTLNPLQDTVLQTFITNRSHRPSSPQETCFEGSSRSPSHL